METIENKTEKQVLGESKRGWVSLVKFIPLMVFAAMVIVFKMDLLLAAPIATFSAVCVYMLLCGANF